MAVRTALQIFLSLIPREWKRRVGVHLGCCDLRWSLQQMRRFGFLPGDVLDVGAFQGEWAGACLEVYPESHITCIEPQDGCQPQLMGLAGRHPNVRVIKTLLGNQVNGEIPFLEGGSGSSVLPPPSGGGSTKPMTTIDRLILDGKLNPPEFVKLDVQGYEQEVLKGWTHGFEQCQVVQCEISLLPLVEGSPQLPELIEYLQVRDFVMFDVTELIRSPHDAAVWQIDALFCRKDSPLRSNRVWRTPQTP